MVKKSKEWQLQEAKNKFSEVFSEALKNGAQTITRNGKDRAFLVSFNEYQQLLKKKQNTLSSFFTSSPLKGTDIEITRNKDVPRDIVL